MSASENRKSKATAEPVLAEGTKQEAHASPPSPSGRQASDDAAPVADYRAKAQSFGRFRLAQDFDRVAGVTKVIVTVKAQKPNGQAWFRVHPDEGYRMQVALLKLKDENEVFLVDPSLVGQLATEVVPHVLYTYVTREGAIAVWPARLPRADGRTDHWMRSEHEAAKLATTSWVRMTANMAAGSFDVHVAKADLPEPEWPDVTFEKLLELAFADHLVESMDHPVLRRLRGES
jgi:hypothetical protein